MEDITLINVTKRFGKILAVHDVSLRIFRGSLFFLIGPSGCGKTTLLRLIAGLCDLEEGDILLGSRSIKDLPPHRRDTVMVFQNYALWPHLTVYQNIAYGLEERKVKKGERHGLIEEALQMVRLQGYEARKPAELSGGEQQRVALARALVVKPKAVLLDEPLSNLDARLREEMRQEIKRIHEETGITMVYVTHDQKEALTMADYIAVMNRGRIEQVGTPQDVYHHPANLFVALFMGEANLLKGRLEKVNNLHGYVVTPLGTFRGKLAKEGMIAGQEVTMMVRPEDLKFHGVGENNIVGKVEKTFFFGATEQVILSGYGYSFKILTLSGETKKEKGQKVAVSFKSDRTILFPAEENP